MSSVLHVRIGDQLVKEVQAIVKAGEFISPSDFVREAIRSYLAEQRRRKAFALLEEGFGRGKREGIPEPTEADYERAREAAWNELHERGRRDL